MNSYEMFNVFVSSCGQRKYCNIEIFDITVKKFKYEIYDSNNVECFGEIENKTESQNFMRPLLTFSYNPHLRYFIKIIINKEGGSSYNSGSSSEKRYFCFFDEQTFFHHHQNNMTSKLVQFEQSSNNSQNLKISQ